MNETRMIYRPEGYLVSFEWHGGAYIDMYSMEEGEPDPSDRTNKFERQHAARQGAPFDVINVWDYAKDVPTIDRTREAFVRHCDEWLADPDNRNAWGL